MECANTKALNKMQERHAKVETSYDSFLDYIDDDLVELQSIIDTIKSKARNFEGLDFTDEVKDLVNECL